MAPCRSKQVILQRSRQGGNARIKSDRAQQSRKEKKQSHLQIQALQPPSPPPPMRIHQTEANWHGQDNAVSGLWAHSHLPPLAILQGQISMVKTRHHPCPIYHQHQGHESRLEQSTILMFVFMYSVDVQDKKRYRGFSGRVTDLLMPSFPGNLPSIARNLFNAVFVVDLASPQGIG